jgi:hypothetical protein
LKAGYEEHMKTTKVSHLLDVDGFKLMGEKELRKQTHTFIEEDHFANSVKTHESKSAKYELKS